ncbi:MAG: YdcF family protein [Streptomycetaceae bacterium]|nr:MAG: YdcF family protein [Streptomycetaceae bacterium]
MFGFKIIRKLLSFIILLILVALLWPLSQVWYAAHNPTIRKADVIVVLGAAQLDGRPGEVLQARLEQAKRIYDLGLATKIITVGSGAPGDRTTEAASSKNWLISHGVPRKAISALAIGRDTYASTISFTDEMKARMKRDAIIVTDPYHCYRAMTMANDQGIVSTCSPATTGPSSIKNAGYRYLIRETGAYLAYITLGRRGIHISDRNQ